MAGCVKARRNTSARRCAKWFHSYKANHFYYISAAVKRRNNKSRWKLRWKRKMASQNHRRHVLILVATAFILCLFIQCGKSQLVFSFCTTSFTRERVPGVCRPLVKCVRNFHQIHRLRNHPCTLKSGHYGVCCPYFSVPAKPKSKTFISVSP